MNTRNAKPDLDPFAVIRHKWIAECARPGFRIRAQCAHAAGSSGQRVGCPCGGQPVASGKDTRGWTRHVCGDCGRFYGYAPPEIASRSSGTRKAAR